MLHKFIGKLLFPKSPEWQQRQLATTTMFVVLTTIVLGAIFGAAMYWLNTKRN